MELTFVSPTLRELDGLEAEILTCGIFEDVRPMRGVAGLCDWRLGARISDLVRAGELTGREGEVTMIAGRPRLRFDKVLILGLGPEGEFDEGKFRLAIRAQLELTARLGTRQAVAELPGRSVDAIAPQQATNLLLEAASERAQTGRDLRWTLIEPPDARRLIQKHTIEERWRLRSLHTRR